MTRVSIRLGTSGAEEPPASKPCHGKAPYAGECESRPSVHWLRPVRLAIDL